MCLRIYIGLDSKFWMKKVALVQNITLTPSMSVIWTWYFHIVRLVSGRTGGSGGFPQERREKLRNLYYPMSRMLSNKPGIKGYELWSNKLCEYSCEINFDPLARCIFLGCSQVTCLKWTFIHFRTNDFIENQEWIKVHFSDNLKVDQSSFWTLDVGMIRKYVMPRGWNWVHFACISNTWYDLLHTLYWIKVHTPWYQVFWKHTRHWVIKVS